MNDSAATVTQATTQSWAEALELLTRHQLPAPPDLPVWPAEVQRLDDDTFGNWAPSHRLYDLMDVLREAWQKAPDGTVIAGIDGHGVRSWAFHLVLRSGPLLVAIQTPVAGPYDDQDSTSEALEGAWELLADLLATAAKLPPQDRTLVVCDADFAGQRWGWVTPGQGWDAIDWQQEPPALFCADMELQGLLSSDHD